MFINIRVTRKGPTSLTRQITEQLSSLIKTGALPAESILPSERTLANALHVARNVVRGSYEYLEKAGVIQREGQKGRRVCSATPRKKSPIGKARKATAKKR